MQIVRMMTLNFWTIYIPSSRNRMFLHQIHPEVGVGRSLMMFSVALYCRESAGGSETLFLIA
jgi:hypothetical protein